MGHHWMKARREFEPRWAWFANYTNSTCRPLIVPDGGEQGVQRPRRAGRERGRQLRRARPRIEDYTDPNIPTNHGAGTNQDPVLVARFEDAFLWGTAPVAASFDQPYSDSLAVLLRLHQYAAFIPKRYPAALAIVNGTGMVAPTL